MTSSSFVARRAGRIFALALVALAGAAAPAPAALPDLLSDPPSQPAISVYVAGAGPQRLLLRFESYVHNSVSAGPLEFLATSTAYNGPVTDLRQVVDRTSRQATAASVVYEDGAAGQEDGHDHFHLQNAVEYSLRDPGSGTLVAPAEKVGFCLLDSQRTGPVGTPRAFTGSCRVADPDAPGPHSVTMGVMPGWRDIYQANLPFQWVDVSEVVPGTYALHALADPSNVIDEEGAPGEGGEVNVLSAPVSVRVPGYVAQTRGGPLGESSVVLEAEEVAPMTGTQGAVEYRIDAAPQNGSVDKPIGQWFSDPVVSYTPNDPAAPVADELTYVARASGSAFPRTPPSAKVLFGDADRIAIQGAPARIVAGTSVQLSAPGATSWRTSSGSITAGGLLTAPAAPGTITVRAVGPSGSSDAVAIEVVPAPAPEPAPEPDGGSSGGSSSGGSALGAPPPAPPPAPVGVLPAPVAVPPAVLPRRPIVRSVAQQVGRFVVVSVTPGQRGRLRISLRRGTRTVSACSVRATAGRPTTCRLRRPRTGRGALRVVTQLLSPQGRVISRRAVPIRRPAHQHRRS